MLGHQAQPDQAAPVLPDESQPAQAEPVEGERPDPLHVPGIAVAVQKRPARLAVQEQHRLAIRRPGLHVAEPQAVDICIARRIAEIR